MPQLSTDSGVTRPDMPATDGSSSAWLMEAHRRLQAGGVTEGLAALRQALAAGALPPETDHVVLGFVAEARRLAATGPEGLGAARQLNEAVLAAAPASTEPLVELLINTLFLQPDPEACRRVIALAQPSPGADGRVHVLLAEHHMRGGDWDGVRRHLRSIGEHRFADAHYAGWHNRARLHLAVQDARAPGADAEALLADPMTRYLGGIGDPDALESELLWIGLFNTFGLPDPYRIVRRALAALWPAATPEAAGVMLAFFHAVQDRDQVDAMLLHARGRPELRAVPGFARAASRHAQEQDDLRGDQEACAGADQAVPPGRSALAPARAAELRARAAALGLLPPGTAALPCLPLPAPPRLRPGPRPFFVGVFGQLRHHADTLPRLREMLDAEMAAAGLRHEVALHLGVAVWDQTGQRPILSPDGNHGGAAVLFERLPPGLRRTVQAAGIAGLEGFRTAFPQTFEAAVAAGQVVETVDRALVEASFGPVDSFDVNRRADFRPEMDQMVAGLFPPPAVPSADFRNQIMMWERIGRFADQIQALEAGLGTPVAGGLMIRCDLLLGQGTLASRIDRILRGQADRHAWVDGDPAATFLDGVGDRYVLGGRTAVLTVSRLWSVLQHLAVQPGGPTPDQARRLLSHTLIGCFLFEQGITVARVPGTELPFTIHRGRLGAGLLRAPMLADLAAMQARDPGSEPLVRALSAALDGAA